MCYDSTPKPMPKCNETSTINLNKKKMRSIQCSAAVYTNDFEHTLLNIALKGSKIRVLFFYCERAP